MLRHALIGLIIATLTVVAAVAGPTSGKKSSGRVPALLITMASRQAPAAGRARAELAKFDAAVVRPHLRRALVRGSESLRIVAATEFGRLGARADVRYLADRVIRDRVAAVRDASTKALRSIDRDLATRTLVVAYEAHGGGRGRAYVQVGAQKSFIQDFDVEVASTAFIADPQVGVVQEGVTLDVAVRATTAKGVRVQRLRIHEALKTLTGAGNVANKPGAWKRWLARERRKDNLRPLAAR
jgi:hypothetical protein